MKHVYQVCWNWLGVLHLYRLEILRPIPLSCANMWNILLSIYPFIHPSIYPFIHPFIHSSIQERIWSLCRWDLMFRKSSYFVKVAKKLNFTEVLHKMAATECSWNFSKNIMYKLLITIFLIWLWTLKEFDGKNIWGTYGDICPSNI